jgi:hypothetical protein
MAAAVLELTIGVAPGTPGANLLAIYGNSTKQLCWANENGFTVSQPVIRENETLAVQPQFSAGQAASPTGNISTTETAMGLGLVSGFSITPQVTGRIAIFVAGMVLNSTAAGDGVNINGRYGTGTAPSNGATTGLGTQFSITQHFIASTTAGQQGFTVIGKVTGLTLNVAVWIDLSIVAVTGGGASVKDVQIVVYEY